MSAVLRRYPLWRRAAWLDSAVEGNALRMRWEDGHADTVVTEILARSASCIPGVSITRKQVSDRVREILMSYTAMAAAPVEPALRSAAVPGTVWDGPAMRHALARREINSVFQVLRRHGVPKRQIAVLTGQTLSEVSEILKGRQVGDFGVLTRIATGLGVPRGLMGLAYDEATASRVAPSALDDSESVKRRKFLAHAAAVTVGAAVFGADSGAWASRNTYLPSPGRVGMTDVRQLEAATQALRALDYEYGPNSCQDAVIAQLSWGQQMLSAPSSALVKERLHAALADLRSLAKGMRHDRLAREVTRGSIGLAQRVARWTAQESRCSANPEVQERDEEIAAWLKYPTIESASGFLLPVAVVRRAREREVDLRRVS